MAYDISSRLTKIKLKYIYHTEKINNEVLCFNNMFITFLSLVADKTHLFIKC